MPDAVTLMRAYAQKKISAKQLSAAFDRLIAHEPEQHPRIRLVLTKAREAGLSARVHDHLLGKLPGAGAQAQTEATNQPYPTTRDRIASHATVPASQTRKPTHPDTAPTIAPAEPTAAPAARTVAPFDDATEINPAEPDRTVMTPAPLSAANERSDNTSSWPLDEGRAHEPEFTAGSMLRGRFRLLSPLGEGGMGMVWKALDLLKEEARDPNPFVAIKLLQGDFKEHPEAFIALQRETAKAQRLAHPNIATTFDFDRDDQTGTVYMTMEVLEGDDLAGFIRGLPQGGLDQPQAMELIEQLAAGLDYAHENQLVHFDLKPGNCFITNDRVIKLLDFGIARASKTRMDAEGEATLFDPRELGALTPTYATIEMFDGLDPDPSDDIYALAIITYQLLTGKHPFDKKSAPKAKELRLVPAPVAGLTKRQNRALANGLAFARADRTPDVATYLDGLRPQKSYAKQIALGASALLLALGLGIYPTLNAKLKQIDNDEIATETALGSEANLTSGLTRMRALTDPEQRVAIQADARVSNAIVQFIAQGGEHGIRTGLRLIAPFPDAWQRTIRETPAAREAIFAWYEQRLDATANASQGRFDYHKGEAITAELANLYVDSARVLELRQHLKREKDTALSALDARFNRVLAKDRLLPDSAHDDLSDVLATVRQLAPDHALLSDLRIPLRFEELVEQAIGEKTTAGYERAHALLEASTMYAPDKSTLNNLRFEVERELKQRADQAQITGLGARLRPQVTGAKSLNDFERLRDGMARLSALAPNHQLVEAFRDGLKLAFSKTFQSVLAVQDWSNAGEQLLSFAPSLDAAFVVEKRAELDAGLSAGRAEGSFDTVQPIYTTTLERITALLAEKAPDSMQWQEAIRTSYLRLLAISDSSNARTLDIRQRIGAVFDEQARAAIEMGRFPLAAAALATGRDLYSDYPSFVETLAKLRAAEQAQRQRQEQIRKLARLDGMKRTLLTQANANQPQEARRLLRAIRQELPADDKFTNVEAPKAIAAAYQNLAARGGAHIDPLSKCDVTLSRPHGGGPDAVTGYRLVRELR
ncbi:MAG: serine/threonine protein kinase [Gammaproteobacteria bacterium]|jgi:serine/threonine protein kinase